MTRTTLVSLFLLLFQDLIHMEDYLVEGYQNSFTQREAEEDVRAVQHPCLVKSDLLHVSSLYDVHATEKYL